LKDQIRIAEHRGEEVVEIVGDSAGEDAEAFELLGLAQQTLDSPTFFLFPPPMRQINDGCYDEGSFGSLDRIETDLNVNFSPVLPKTCETLRERCHLSFRRAPLEPGDGLPMQIPEAFGHQRVHRLSDDLLPSIPEKLLSLGVEQPDAAPIVDQNHGDGRRLERQPELRL